MFPVALQRLRVSLRGGVALAVEFATLGEVVLEHEERELLGENQDRSSAGRLIGERTNPAVRPATAAARARLRAKQPAQPVAHEPQQRGTVTAVEPECASRVRAPSREPRRRRPQPDPPFQFCLD